MKTYINDESREIGYTLQGDYYLPDFKFSEKGTHPIGIWGHRHLRYLKRYRKVLYYNLLTSGRLNGYLADVDKQAENLFSRIAQQIAEREGVNEQLKATHVMEWVRQMNNIRNRTAEIVNSEIILR